MFNIYFFVLTILGFKYLPIKQLVRKPTTEHTHTNSTSVLEQELNAAIIVLLWVSLGPLQQCWG